MPLNRVSIESFRCLTRVELALHPERTYLFGPNGAGKTSLLEAVHVLGRGRSFRTRHTRRLIQHQRSGFSVFGEVRAEGAVHRLGVGCRATGLELRLNGAPAPGTAAMARLLPVHVIEPNSHSLIEGSPGDRRRFLDWGVFHVEQSYLAAWRGYRRALSQRNAALKCGEGVGSWDAGFVEAGTAVDRARRRYVEALGYAAAGLGEALLGQPLAVSYRAGWPQGMSLTEALAGSADRERAWGTTQVGPHRADLVIRLDARGVRDDVSRGQQKLIAAGLILAQTRVFAAGRGHGGVLLVDDPAAELDERALAGLISVLDELPVQQVITGLSQAALPAAPAYPVFHVEPGGGLSML
ncbi:MAG: DNA replication/repair protein RecF [Rhodospirillaceae bacterium]|nr:DNA replication/repair protein RecF [Rhodospirillaceae bacterium]